MGQQKRGADDERTDQERHRPHQHRFGKIEGASVRGMTRRPQRMQKQAHAAQQAKAGIGTVGIPVYEGRGKIARVGPFLQPQNAFPAGEVVDQPIGGIDGAGDGDRHQYVPGPGPVAPKLHREPEHPAIAGQPQNGDQGHCRVHRNAGQNAGRDRLGQRVGSLVPKRVGPKRRNRRQGLYKRPGQHHRKGNHDGPQPLHRYRNPGATDKNQERPQDQERAGPHGKQTPGPRAVTAQGQRRQQNQGQQ